jgi:uncharacterized protein YrrD
MNKFDLHIGAQVHCLDGECGKLAKIAVDPATFHVTDLIVEKGLLLKQARVFPFSTVAYAESEDVHLALYSSDLLNYAEYHEAIIEHPATDWDGRSGYRTETANYPILATAYDPSIAVATVRQRIREGLSPELETVVKGTLIKNTDGIVGKLSHLLTDPESGEITHLMVQQGLLFPEHLNIPVDFVENISEESIFLSPSYEELDDYWQQTQEYTS